MNFCFCLRKTVGRDVQKNKSLDARNLTDKLYGKWRDGTSEEGRYDARSLLPAGPLSYLRDCTSGGTALISLEAGWECRR